MRAEERIEQEKTIKERKRDVRTDKRIEQEKRSGGRKKKEMGEEKTVYSRRVERGQEKEVNIRRGVPFIGMLFSDAVGTSGYATSNDSMSHQH